MLNFIHRPRKLTKIEFNEAVRTIQALFPEHSEYDWMETVRNIADMWGLSYPDKGDDKRMTGGR